MPRPETVMKALPAQARARIHSQGDEFRRSYVEYDDAGNKVAILCKHCGVPIARWVDDDIVDQHKIPGTDIVRLLVRQRFLKLSNYAQLHLKLDNGSLFEPVVCADCLPTITPDDYEKIFAAELYAWGEEIAASGKGADSYQPILEYLANRHIAGPA